MKTFLTPFLIAITLLFSGMSSAKAADQGNITIHITGLNNNKGVVRIALFNTDNAYSSSIYAADKAFKKDLVDIHSNEGTYTFQNVPYGEYAIKMFHDEDNSGKFITGMFGIPKVQYAFSNNAHGSFGPAKYDKAKFMLNQPQLTQTIKMIGH